MRTKERTEVTQVRYFYPVLPHTVFLIVFFVPETFLRKAPLVSTPLRFSKSSVNLYVTPEVSDLFEEGHPARTLRHYRSQRRLRPGQNGRSCV